MGAVQLTIILALMAYYKYTFLYDYNLGIFIFKTFNLSPYINIFLPLSDFLIYLINVFSIMAVSFSISYFSYKERRGKFAVSAIVCVGFVLWMYLFYRNLTNKVLGIITIFPILMILKQIRYNVFLAEEVDKE